MNSDICQIKMELDVFEISGPNAKVRNRHVCNSHSHAGFIKYGRKYVFEQKLAEKLSRFSSSKLN